MSESLRDQLLKAGFAKKASPESKPASKKSPLTAYAAKAKPAATEVDLARAYAQRVRAERVERERAQREVERIAREKRERKQKLAALLAGKALNAADADTPRHFP